MNYFEVKVKHSQIDEITGKEKLKTDSFLIDALSFTEAESRMNEEIEKMALCEYRITHERVTKIEEVHKFDESGSYYLCKIAFIDSDDNGKSKTTNAEMLINAESTKEANERANVILKDVLVPYRIKKIIETGIKDVFDYEESNFNSKYKPES